MEYTLKKIESVYYEEIYSWRKDPFAKEHNPFADLDFEQFQQSLLDCSWNLSDLYSGKNFRWVVTKNGVPAAMVSLTNINKMMKTAEIGYQVNPRFRKQGIGTNAVQKLVLEVFKKTDLRKLIAYITHTNVPSCKIVEKIGFKQEGLLRKHYLIDDREVDEKLYGLLREDVSKRHS